MPNEIHSYIELQQQIHQDLRDQHSDWVQPNGDSPICNSYELRLAGLLGLTSRQTVERMQPSRFLGYTDDY